MEKVNVKFLKNLQHEINVGDFKFIVDEPKDYGGDNKGPSPYNMLLAALGSCTSMTMLMYARRKDWNIQSIEIDLHHEKIHAENCEECETKTGKLDKITRYIKVKGDINQEQRQKLLTIAEKCPVHKTLTHENIIVDKIETSCDI